MIQTVNLVPSWHFVLLTVRFTLMRVCDRVILNQTAIRRSVKVDSNRSNEIQAGLAEPGRLCSSLWTHHKIREDVSTVSIPYVSGTIKWPRKDLFWRSNHSTSAFLFLHAVRGTKLTVNGRNERCFLLSCGLTGSECGPLIS